MGGEGYPLSAWSKHICTKRCPRHAVAWTLSEVIFDLDNADREIADLDKRSQEPDFWDDPDKAQEVMRRMAALRSRLEPYRLLVQTYDDVIELRDLLEAERDPGAETELGEMAARFLKDLDALELATLLSGPYDENNAIVEIGAGAGGTEACDWAEMLFRMYSRFAEQSGYKVEILTSSPGDVTGLRGISFMVSGSLAYGYLKGEQGVHRLVRISPYDASGRRHTSFASVTVLPEVKVSEVDIKPEDLRVETFRASGAGGQHVNKTESAVRFIHIPTGIVVGCQTERSQHKNRATAMSILAAKLVELERDKTEEHLKMLKGETPSAEWGRQIRSYVLQPYTLVKDTRTGMETGNVQAVLEGNIGDFINAYLRGGDVR